MDLPTKLLYLYIMGMLIFTWHSFFIVVPKVPYRRHKRNLYDFIQCFILSFIWLPFILALIADTIYNPIEEEEEEDNGFNARDSR